MRIFLWMFVIIGILLIAISVAANIIEPAIADFLLVSGLTILILGIIFLVLNSMISLGNINNPNS